MLLADAKSWRVKSGVTPRGSGRSDHAGASYKAIHQEGDLVRIRAKGCQNEVGAGQNSPQVGNVFGGAVKQLDGALREVNVVNLAVLDIAHALVVADDQRAGQALTCSGFDAQWLSSLLRLHTL